MITKKELENKNNILIEKLKNKEQVILNLNEEKENLDKEIAEKNVEAEDKKKEILNLNEEKENSDKEIAEKNVEAEDKKKEISDLNEEKENLQNKLDEKETKKLAKAFKNEKKEYEKKLAFWKQSSLIIFVVFILLVIVLTYFSLDFSFEKKISFIIIDLVMGFFTFFSIKQYSFYTNLYASSLNKQTLTQAYYNILKSDEDHQIKEEYKEKLVSVICSKNDFRNKENLPVEKLLKIVENFSEK